MNSKQFLTQCYKLSQGIASRQRAQQISTAVVCKARNDVHPNYEKIKAKYRHFQNNDGTPVHLKGGPFDYVLYFSTVALTIVGVAGCFHLYYTMAFPKKSA